MSDEQVQAPFDVTTRWSGKAIVAAGAALGAVVLAGVQPLSAVLALVAVVGALLARRNLKDDSTLRGFGVSLAAFLVGAALLVVSLVPGVLTFLVLTFAAK